jgi:hypothetical protein
MIVLSYLKECRRGREQETLNRRAATRDMLPMAVSLVLNFGECGVRFTLLHRSIIAVLTEGQAGR